MTRAATGLSTDPDSLRAAVEAARRALARLEGDRPDWSVIFVTAEHRPKLSVLLGALSETLGTPYVVGCSAAGVMAEGQEVEEGPAVAVLAVRSDRLRATPFFFQDDGDQGLTAGVRLGQRLMTSRDSDDLVLVWPDPFHIRPDRLLQGLDATLGDVPVAGAAASARTPDGNTFQFSGSEAGPRAVSGVRLGGDLRFDVTVTQGCRPLGRPVTVTRSHENLLLEVDGRPALDVLRERAPGPLLENDSLMFHYLFVGLLPGSDAEQDYLIRNIVAVDSDTGVLAVAERLEEGQRVVFALREGKAARNDLSRRLPRVAAESARSRFSFGFYFNCLARGRSLYGEDGVDAKLLREVLPGVPLLGMFGNAEIAPLQGVNHVFTYTGVLVLVAAD